MILIGQYYTKDVIKEWLLEGGIYKAKSNVKKFNKINKLFNNFVGYENKKSENVIFLLCSRNFKEEINAINYLMLSRIENALQSLDIEQWSSAKKNYFISVITSDDISKSYSPFNELIFYSLLIDKFDVNKVELYPEIRDGLSSDIKISCKDENIYIEIGSLNKSLPSLKIEHILNECVEYFGKKYKLGHVRFEVDSANFPLDLNDNIDVEQSINAICKELDRLNLYDLKPFNDLIILNDLITYLKNEELFKQSVEQIFPFLYKVISLESVKNWLEKNKKELKEGFEIITTLTTHTMDHTYIEFHTEYQTPSKSAPLIHSSYINHIIRHIEEQLYQIYEGKTNIIAIHTNHLNMFIIGDVFIINYALITEMKKYIQTKNIQSLAGILLYEYNTGESIYISNMNNSNVEKILYKLGVKNIY